MIWCTVCGNYSTLLACGGISQFPEPRVAKFKTAYIDEINEPTKSMAVVIISSDGYWWMRERGTWRILISGKLPIPPEYSDYEVHDER